MTFYCYNTTDSRVGTWPDNSTSKGCAAFDFLPICPHLHKAVAWTSAIDTVDTVVEIQKGVVSEENRMKTVKSVCEQCMQAVLVLELSADSVGNVPFDFSMTPGSEIYCM